MTCERCKGLGFIRTITVRLNDVEPGQPQTVTVIAVHDPEFCPACGGSGAAVASRTPHPTPSGPPSPTRGEGFQ